MGNSGWFWTMGGREPYHYYDGSHKSLCGKGNRALPSELYTDEETPDEHKCKVCNKRRKRMIEAFHANTR